MLKQCDRLPLDVVMIVTSELYPKIQELQSSFSGTTANTAIVDLLRSANLEQHLPKPVSLNPRRFAVSATSYMTRCSCIYINLVVRRVDSLVDVPHLGRDIRSWHDPTWYLELDKRAVILC